MFLIGKLAKEKITNRIGLYNTAEGYTNPNYPGKKTHIFTPLVIVNGEVKAIQKKYELFEEKVELLEEELYPNVIQFIKSYNKMQISSLRPYDIVRIKDSKSKWEEETGEFLAIPTNLRGNMIKGSDRWELYSLQTGEKLWSLYTDEELEFVRKGSWDVYNELYNKKNQILI